ncbi:hypothetical protein FEM48_Zijuj07G0113700 [Ziziphus jujuba var. spinosa]|uniref:Uncharacterized protein n=1 Tax=Ziziphus jujuba var. spinosa TaxID=714518 RepID=A0A978V4C3_ZIZJJ|nr:hypothetical protein FEM48_Zijuj07G0113700 [Ziziphus jujuba var. spinosa]
MLKVLENFGKWKGQLAKNNFESAFKEYHNKVIKDSHHCNSLDIENLTAVLCPDCSCVIGRRVGSWRRRDWKGCSLRSDPGVHPMTDLVASTHWLASCEAGAGYWLTEHRDLW